MYLTQNNNTKKKKILHHQIPTPPITIDAPTITTTVPKSNALTDVQLRVTKLEKDVSKLKKIDHSTKALATLKSRVPTVVEQYLRSKISDDLQKSASEIVKIKRDQAEKKKMPKYTIKSTNNAALKEYDQKSDLYQTMHENKYFNRNHANHALYHALMESLIEDENAMDKGVADIGKKTKRRRTKDSKSSKKLSTTKETPKDTSKPKTHKTLNPDWFKQPLRPPTLDPEWNKRQVILDQAEQPGINQMVSTRKDPLTFNDLLATPIDLSKYVLNRLKIDNLNQDLLLGHAFNLLKGTYTSNIELKYNFQECFNALTKKLDWNHPEGDCYPFDLSKPLPLKFLLYKFKEGDFIDLHWNDVKDMLILAVQHKLFHLNESDILRIESYQKKLNITAPQQTFLEIEIKELYTPSYKLPGVIYEDLTKRKRVMQADKLYKFSNGTLKKVWDELHHKLLDFHLGYNDEMSWRKWTAIDKKRSELMVELIDKKMRER
ncbi:hypothetical protein Tco_0903343 [Tanacetum coccineum]